MIVGTLAELATKIAPVVLSRRKGFVEKDLEEFYKSVKEYHGRVTDILMKRKGSPKRLSKHIAEDKLFGFLADHETKEKIANGLLYVGSLPRAKRYDRSAVLRAILKVLEEIRATHLA